MALQWPRLGPYHLARIDATHRLLAARGGRAVAIEVASSDQVYQWRPQVEPTSFERRTLFPGVSYESVSLQRIYSRLNQVLDALRPTALALNGYSFRESWIALWWCRRRGCAPILMSDSKADDKKRRAGAERLKQILVGQFAAALCAGSLHRAYLVQLGMRSEAIFCGYDVVDNDFFARGAAEARRRIASHEQYPGLDSRRPFFLASARFIPRKNLLALINAYRRYRSLETGIGRKPWRLVLLGDGPEREAIESFVADRHIPDVTLAGFQQIDVLPAYYGRAAVFVHPALQDQWGLVVNEAMAAGLPVLVSEGCGCAPDLVENGRNGFTFVPDDVPTLAKLLQRCSSGNYDLSSMGQASQEIISHWGVDRFARSLCAAVSHAVTPLDQLGEPCTS